MFNNRNPFTKEGLLDLLEENHPRMTEANFQNKPLQISEIQRLAAALETNIYVTDLNVLECNLDKEKMEVLSKGIFANNSLRSIQIEKFANDPPELKQLIDKIYAHIGQDPMAYCPPAAQAGT